MTPTRGRDTTRLLADFGHKGLIFMAFDRQKDLEEVFTQRIFSPAGLLQRQ